ncbi:MAG: hypothetical protein QXE31_00490 [Candidatus Woesearchaeota archaeon]
MAIIGFHFTKMSVERKKQPSGKINVKNNVILTDIKEANVISNVKQKAIEFKFAYNTIYEPEIASLSLEGALVFVGNDELVNKALETWNKEKKLVEEIIPEVYNYLLEKCSIEALILAKEMNLPPHVPLPKVSSEKQSEEVKEDSENKEKKEDKETKKKK